MNFFKTKNMKNHFLLIKNKMNCFNGFRILLIIFSFSLLIGFKTQGQNLKFYKIGESVANSSDLINDEDADAERLNILLTGLNPAIYFSNGKKQINGEGIPVVVDTDVKSLNELYKENQEFNQVEIIKISLNSTGDLNFVLNIDNLQSFYQLKYILADFSFDLCGKQSDECLISKMKEIVNCKECNVIIISRLLIPN